MVVLTLASIAEKVAIENIKDIASVGDLPVKPAWPILCTITNLDQLDKVQADSPHLAVHTSPIWKHLLVRKYGKAAISDRFAPLSDEKWNETYYALRQEYEIGLMEATAILQKSMAQAKDDHGNGHATRLMTKTGVPNIKGANGPRRTTHWSKPKPTSPATASGAFSKVQREVGTIQERRRMNMPITKRDIEAKTIAPLTAPKHMILDRQEEKRQSILLPRRTTITTQPLLKPAFEPTLIPSLRENKKENEKAKKAAGSTQQLTSGSRSSNAGPTTPSPPATPTSAASPASSFTFTPPPEPVKEEKVRPVKRKAANPMVMPKRRRLN